MLILKRKEGERILISDGETEIWVTMVDRLKGRLGLEAPDRFQILREELLDEGKANGA